MLDIPDQATPKPATAPDVLLEADAARMLGVAPSTLGRMRREGRGPAAFRYAGGRDWRYTRAAVESWLAAQVAGGTKTEG